MRSFISVNILVLCAKCSVDSDWCIGIGIGSEIDQCRRGLGVNQKIKVAIRAR